MVVVVLKSTSKLHFCGIYATNNNLSAFRSRSLSTKSPSLLLLSIKQTIAQIKRMNIVEYYYKLANFLALPIKNLSDSS